MLLSQEKEIMAPKCSVCVWIWAVITSEQRMIILSGPSLDFNPHRVMHSTSKIARNKVHYELSSVRFGGFVNMKQDTPHTMTRKERSIWWTHNLMNEHQVLEPSQSINPHPNTPRIKTGLNQGYNIRHWRNSQG